VSPDSADFWASPELFQTDDENLPSRVAGCPPDGFSATGQLWGNPLYDWDYHEQTNYDWWLKRISKCREFYDIIRIDHFRGFDEYYSIPAGEDTAKNGRWVKGPGMKLFRRIKEKLGNIQIIAEDLGYITDSVREMVRESGYPNMKIIEFAFDSRDSSSRDAYFPHNYTKNCVVYTGTHDNETLAGWLGSILPEER
jgi:4-alpha-glucanotransferase